MSPKCKSARNACDVESDRPGRPGRSRVRRRKQGWHLGVRNPQLPTQSRLGRSGVETSTMRLVTLVQDDRNVGEVVA